MQGKELMGRSGKHVWISAPKQRGLEEKMGSHLYHFVEELGKVWPSSAGLKTASGLLCSCCRVWEDLLHALLSVFSVAVGTKGENTSGLTCIFCYGASNSIQTHMKAMARKKSVKTCTVVNTEFNYDICLLISRYEVCSRHSSIL